MGDIPRRSFIVAYLSRKGILRGSGRAAFGVAGVGFLEKLGIAQLDTEKLAKFRGGGVKDVTLHRPVEGLHRLDELWQVLAKDGCALAPAVVRHGAVPDHPDKQKQAAGRA